MSAHREEFLDLCAGYALGSLDDADRVRLEEHLEAGCPECEAALTDFGQASVLLAHSAPRATPGRALRERVLIAAASDHPGHAPGNVERRRNVVPMSGWVSGARSRTFAWMGLAAAAAFAVVAGLLLQNTQRLERTLAEDRTWAAITSAPGAKVAELQITPAGVHELKARAVYDPKTKSAVIVFDNFQAPSGHDYELWAIRDAKPVALGLVTPDASGRAVMRLENVGEPGALQAFAVSLEPTGGAPTPNAPTGPIVMMAKIGG